MTIYSIVPEETIWASQQPFEPNYVDLVVNGVSLQAEMLNENQARVVRLYSGNPLDYLNPGYAPGSLIEFHAALRS